MEGMLFELLTWVKVDDVHRGASRGRALPPERAAVNEPAGGLRALLARLLLMAALRLDRPAAVARLRLSAQR